MSGWGIPHLGHNGSVGVLPCSSAPVGSGRVRSGKRRGLYGWAGVRASVEVFEEFVALLGAGGVLGHDVFGEGGDVSSRPALLPRQTFMANTTDAVGSD